METHHDVLRLFHKGRPERGARRLPSLLGWTVLRAWRNRLRSDFGPDAGRASSGYSEESARTAVPNLLGCATATPCSRCVAGSGPHPRPPSRPAEADSAGGFSKPRARIPRCAPAPLRPEPLESFLLSRSKRWTMKNTSRNSWARFFSHSSLRCLCRGGSPVPRPSSRGSLSPGACSRCDRIRRRPIRRRRAANPLSNALLRGTRPPVNAVDRSAVFIAKCSGPSAPPSA